MAIERDAGSRRQDEGVTRPSAHSPMSGTPDSDAGSQGHVVGVVGATALGVGGMIGAGLLAMLGLAARRPADNFPWPS